MKIIKFTMTYVLKYKIYLLIFILLNFVSRALAIFFPYLTGNYIDILITANDFQIVTKITLIIITIGIFNMVSSFAQRYLNVKIQTKAMIDLNFDVLNHLLKMPIRYFENKNSGYLNHRINNDSSVVVNFLLDNLLNIVSNALTIIILFYISFTINVKMTLILIPVFPLYLFLYYIFRKPLYRRNYDLKEKQNIFFSKMNQHLQNVNIVKINATFTEAHEVISNSFKSMFKSLLSHTKLSLLFTNSNSFTMLVANGLIFFFGGREVIRGNMSVGEFTIIKSYFSMIMGSISYFLNFGESYQKALVSYDRLKQILDESKEINGNKKIFNISNIKLENVAFSYNKSEKIISNFNQKFKKGKVYCVIGSNGTGKSTLIKLLLGIYNDYYDGKIHYDTNEIKNLDMYYIRKNFVGVCMQEPKTINSKLIENFTYGLEQYNFDNLSLILNKLKLDPAKFDNGLETIIDEASNNISGGEKLKINLARNFLKSPELLVLDEPSSALDVESVDKLKDLIVETKLSRITIIISHDHDFINIADEVIDLNKHKRNDI
ncbi:ABC transporter ATP-binding protein [Proteinivorax tanatarense]|uniref:ABC transporter ATP-binding protein n=1 Tax=Proteinivorax tanatarense TaxID=1260629 RepID=A0AAU7VKF6_9FIRM